MMKTQLLLLSIMILAYPSDDIYSQTNEIMMSWTPVSSPSDDVVCYQVQLDLVSAGSEVLLLGSQNYRFYYDGRQMRLRRDLSTSLLPEMSYSDIMVTQDIYDSNAEGFGPLSFDDHLSFANFGINDGGNISHLVSLSSGMSVMTARVCFDELISGAKDIVWSRPELTSGYATAYAEISYYDEQTQEIHQASIRCLDSEASAPAEDQEKIVTKNDKG